MNNFDIVMIVLHIGCTLNWIGYPHNEEGVLD